MARRRVPDDLQSAARTVAFLARVLERASADLTLAQYRVLVLVDAGDERASLIAERLAVGKPTITAVVDGLVERGYLDRASVEGDRRSVRLTVTRAGRAAVTTAEDAMGVRLGELLDGVEDRAGLLTGLREVRTALSARLADRARAREDPS